MGFERSEDGENWSPIDEATARRRLKCYFRDVESLRRAMREDGQPVRTPFALYRFVATGWPKEGGGR